MLSSVQNGSRIIGLILIINVALCRGGGSSTSQFLNRLLNRQREGPVVVFLEPSNAGTKVTTVDIGREQAGHSQEVQVEFLDNEDRAQDNDNNDATEVQYQASQGENDAYVLYNILRSTQQEEDLDEEASNLFERTKDILRSAFALRCVARQQCETKCPPKKVECKTTCEQTTTTRSQCTKRKCTTTTEQPQSCVRKCEPKPSKCARTCQKNFDTLNACEEPPKKDCNQPKCGGGGGKTMPPKWLRNFLRQRI